MKKIYIVWSADGKECDYRSLSKKEWKKIEKTLPSDGSVLYRRLNIFQSILFKIDISIAILIDILRDGNK